MATKTRQLDLKYLEGLSPESVIMFNAYHANYVLSFSDCAKIREMLLIKQRLQKVRKDIDTQGESECNQDSGRIYINPLLNIETTLSRQYMTLLKGLKLSKW